MTCNSNHTVDILISNVDDAGLWILREWTTKTNTVACHVMLKQLPISAYTSLTALSSQTRKLKEFNTSSKSALKRLLVIQIQISCALTTTCTTSRVTSTIQEGLRGVLCRSRTKRLTTQVCSSEITACIIYISNLSLKSCKVEIPGERLSNLCHRIYWPAFLQWLMEKRETDNLVIKIW